MHLRVRECDICTSCPHNPIQTLNITSTLTLSGLQSQAELQRRFDQTVVAAQYTAVPTAQVFAPIPTDYEVDVTGDNIPEMCHHAKLQIEALARKDGYCNPCLMKPTQPLPLERKHVFYPGDISILQDLVDEFGHFNAYEPAQIREAKRYEDRLQYQRRAQSVKQTIKKQRTTLREQLIQYAEQGGSPNVANIIHAFPSEVEAEPTPEPEDLEWNEWVADDVVRGWKTEDGPEEKDQIDQNNG